MGFEELVNKLEPRLLRLSKKYYRFFGSFDSSDLYQEAFINLWQRFENREFQDKNDSYIIKSCYFHIQNFIRTHKDNAGMFSLDEPLDSDTEYTYKDLLEKPSSNPKDRISDKLTVDEMLNNGLTKREKDVLCLMLQGLNVREVAKEMAVSHVRVIKLKDSIRRKYKYKII